MKRERQEMKKGILSISYLLIVLMIAALTACGGLKGPMIPKSSIPADIDADVKKEIERLYSSSSSKRENGAHNLGIIGKEAAPAVPFLIDMLKDKEEDVRESVAIALGKIGDLSAVEPLIAALLKDKYEDVRKSAAWALGNIKEPRAIEPLITALKNNKRDEEVQMNAAWALGNIKDTRAVEPLIVALKLIAESSDEEKLVGKNAAWALGKIGDPRAIEPLISAMKDEEKGLKGKVVRNILFGGILLGTIQSVKITGGIKERDMGEQWSVAWAIADIGKPAVEPLIAALNNKDSDEYIRKRAPLALGRIGDSRAVEPLIAALKDENNEVRFSAAIALGDIKDPRAIEPLIAILKGEPLIATLKDDDDGDVRRSAAWALGKIGDLRAVEPLIAALKDEDVYVRKSAKEALGKISGNDLGQDHAKWQAWWAENKNKQLASPRQ